MLYNLFTRWWNDNAWDMDILINWLTFKETIEIPSHFCLRSITIMLHVLGMTLSVGYQFYTSTFLHQIFLDALIIMSHFFRVASHSDSDRSFFSVHV